MFYTFAVEQNSSSNFFDSISGKRDGRGASFKPQSKKTEEGTQINYYDK